MRESIVSVITCITCSSASTTQKCWSDEPCLASRCNWLYHNWCPIVVFRCVAFSSVALCCSMLRCVVLRLGCFILSRFDYFKLVFNDYRYNGTCTVLLKSKKYSVLLTTMFYSLSRATRSKKRRAYFSYATHVAYKLRLNKSSYMMIRYKHNANK